MSLPLLAGLRVLAIDPGPTESAWVVYDSECRAVIAAGKAPNNSLLEVCRNPWEATKLSITDCVCERIRSYGMPAGAELFETCEWCGRFQEAWEMHHIYATAPHLWHWMPRKDVKMHLCGQTRAKDANIRQAIIDRFGGQSAIGRKAAPGPLYGIAGDEWAALAVALTWCDLRALEAPHA